MYPLKSRFVTITVALLTLCSVGLATPKPKARTWTDQTGDFNVKATLVGVKVVLEKEDGTTIEVPFGRLSREDQEYVKRVTTDVDVLIGKVAGITDGDTLIVVDDAKNQYSIRLEGIDAPEGSQAYGAQSKKALAAKVFQKHVRIEWREKDRYERILGQIYLDDRWINKEMVEEGWAWHYKQYSDLKELAEVETKAKSDRNGLWADENPMPPWEFRYKPVMRETPGDTPAKKLATPPTVTPPPRASPKKDVTVYVTRTGSKYHQEGCQYLRQSKIPMSLREAKRRFSPCSRCRPP